MAPAVPIKKIHETLSNTRINIPHQLISCSIARTLYTYLKRQFDLLNGLSAYRGGSEKSEQDEYREYDGWQVALENIVVIDQEANNKDDDA